MNMAVRPSLESTLSSQLQCNVCRTFITSSIFQCGAGHNFCNTCINDIDFCVKCQYPKGMVRNYAMERVRSELTCQDDACKSDLTTRRYLLEIAISEELTCRICWNYMRPMVPQCLNGHNICLGCYHLKCSLCGTSRATSRNISLESALDYLKLPCKYENFGCHYTGTGISVVEKHETGCTFGLKACPVRFINHSECKWRGKTQEIVKHCVTEHKTLPVGSTIGFSLRKFNVGHRTRRIIVGLAYDRLFRLVMSFNDEKDMVRVGCYFYGKQMKDNPFRYELSILKADSGEVVTKFRSICCNVVNDNILFVEPYKIDVCHARWSEYCNAEGSLNFKLQIIDNTSLSIPC